MFGKLELRDEVDVIRGFPIAEYDGDPLEIPCVETSDPESLCRHPVVSVHMLTYNHEPFIRQAIEGVMMQRTDFEFELVIGEDCSTDRTREICFEYQRRYPEKIRVLWSQENSYRNMHPAGGNAQRTIARCRGEFVAFCEGDDYWTDPLKLQKQVDVLRARPDVAICFCGVSRYHQESGLLETTRYDNDPVGQVSGEEINRALMVNFQDRRQMIRQHGLQTSGFVFRRRAYDEGRLNGVEKWCLSFVDTITIERCLTRGDAYFLTDVMSVYRIHAGGICSVRDLSLCVSNDAAVVKYYLSQVRFGMSREDALRLWSDAAFGCLCRQLDFMRPGYIRTLWLIFGCEIWRKVCLTKRHFLPTVNLLLGLHGCRFVRDRVFRLSRRLFGSRIDDAEAREIFSRSGFSVSEDKVFADK